MHEKEKHKIHVDGFAFNSKREVERYNYLKELEENGLIRDLTIKKEFTLSSELGMLHALNGKPLRYFIDFTYFDIEKGHLVYEDVKKHLDEFTYCKRQILEMFAKITIKIV